jgi:hypothetical protein
MPGDVFDDTLEEFLAREAAEHQRRLRLTEELGLRRLGYVPEGELVPAARAMTDSRPGWAGTSREVN